MTQLCHKRNKIHPSKYQFVNLFDCFLRRKIRATFTYGHKIKVVFSLLPSQRNGELWKSKWTLIKSLCTAYTLLAFVVISRVEKHNESYEVWNDRMEMFCSRHTIFVTIFGLVWRELFSEIEHKMALVSIIISMNTRPPEKLVMRFQVPL